MDVAVFQKNFYLQKQAVGWIWPTGHSLLTPTLYHKKKQVIEKSNHLKQQENIRRPKNNFLKGDSAICNKNER